MALRLQSTRPRGPVAEWKFGERSRMPVLVIAMYHCEVAGKQTDSVDYQVRYFACDSIDEVMTRLREEPPIVYQNPAGEGVRWVFEDTVAAEVDPKFADGGEVIGFITGRADKIVEPGAAPNGGPATPFGNPEVTGGPPSVS